MKAKLIDVNNKTIKRFNNNNPKYKTLAIAGDKVVVLLPMPEYMYVPFPWEPDRIFRYDSVVDGVLIFKEPVDPIKAVNGWFTL